MNRIDIFAPRWRDRKLLIAAWKVREGDNEIRILARKKDGTSYYPNPIYTTGEQLWSYPQVKHKHGQMIEADLDELLEGKTHDILHTL